VPFYFCCFAILFTYTDGETARLEVTTDDALDVACFLSSPEGSVILRVNVCTEVRGVGKWLSERVTVTMKDPILNSFRGGLT
jgi:hypothetical protein